MSSWGRTADRLRGRRTARSPVAGSPPLQVPPPGRQDPAVPPSELHQRREALAREFAELQWDLGGLAYEMASRDHFRLDVLTLQAAKLQQVDAELSEAERLLKLEQAGAAGSCPSCGALYARGAAFCWQCGMDLMETVTPSPGYSAEPAPAPPASAAPPPPLEPAPPAPLPPVHPLEGQVGG